MATHLSILAWEIPWTEELGRLQSMGLKESDMSEHAHTSVSNARTLQLHMEISLGILQMYLKLITFKTRLELSH